MRTQVSFLDFDQEQLKVHAGGEYYKAGGAVGDWDAWLRKDDGEKQQQQKQFENYKENKQSQKLTKKDDGGLSNKETTAKNN